MFINTKELKDDLANGDKKSNKNKSELKRPINEEQMLDIAELCFMQMSEIMIKQGRTVRDVFGKYAVPDLMPDQKTMLELLSPSAFIEACKEELKLGDLQEVEVACLMRVLSKPELDDSIIMHEFAMIMENFGVPLMEGGPPGRATISDDEDYCCEGEEKPRSYDLSQIDEEGTEILK